MYPPWRAARRAGRLDKPVTQSTVLQTADTLRERASARKQLTRVARRGGGAYVLQLGESGVTGLKGATANMKKSECFH